MNTKQGHSRSKFLAQNVIKIIFRTFPGKHRVFNCRIKELENPTKLNLHILISPESGTVESLMSWNSNFRNDVILRNYRTPKFSHGHNLKTSFHNFSFLLQIALWGLKKVPKPRISDFSILRRQIIAWVDSFHSEMK